jgi:hypothetical protein
MAHSQALEREQVAICETSSLPRKRLLVQIASCLDAEYRIHRAAITSRPSLSEAVRADAGRSDTHDASAEEGELRDALAPANSARICDFAAPALAPHDFRRLGDRSKPISTRQPQGG